MRAKNAEGLKLKYQRFYKTGTKIQNGPFVV